MKKSFFLSIAFLSVSSIVFAQAGKTKKDTASQQMYTCTMHPEVKSSKMGKCPKCGMTLVPVKGTRHMDSSMHKMPMQKMDTSMHKTAAVHKTNMHKMDSSIHKMPMQKMDTSISKMPR